MARLIDYKGSTFLQIKKDNTQELALLAVHNEFLLEHKGDYDGYHQFGIYDYCQGDISNCDKSEYTSLLSKICDNSELELIIFRDPPQGNSYWPSIATHKWSEEIQKNLFYDRNGRLLDIFIKETGQYPKNTEFKWTEENKPEKE